MMGMSMIATTDEEEFEITCGSGEGRARMSLVGSKGTEILIIMPFSTTDPLDGKALEAMILKLGASRLRKALLSLISKSWPTGM